MLCVPFRALRADENPAQSVHVISARLLSRPGGRGYRVREDQSIYGDERNDFDPDFDSDLDQDAKEPQSDLADNP